MPGQPGGPYEIRHLRRLAMAARHRPRPAARPPAGAGPGCPRQRVRIAVDGGVKTENIRQVVHAGVDMLIMGTALFTPSNMVAAVRAIRESIAELPHR